VASEVIMSVGQEQRPKYYEGQYLGAADLEAAVTYTRLREARHLLGAHTWGIAAGLQLQQVTPPGGGNGVNMFVRPGYGWEGFGRPVVVLQPYQIPPVLFQSYTYDPANPDGVLVAIWLEYVEAETGPPQPGFELCSTTDQSSRVVETFRLRIGPHPTVTSQRDPISVAGRSIDASAAYQSFVKSDELLYDASVPFQSFPDEGVPARWLIPLGYVRWQPNQAAGQPGSFAPRSKDDLAKSQALRVYIGAVAGSVLAADSYIRMAGRTQKDLTPPPFSDDLVWVEGTIRAQGDIRLWGTQIDFRDAGGADEGTPCRIRRTNNTAAGTTALDVVINNDSAPPGSTWFGVGPLKADGTVNEKFVVLDNGNVGIGTTTPTLPLQVPGTGIQVGTSTTSTDNFYFASDTNNGPRGLRFYNQNAPKGVPLVTFQSDGKVGIGTTSPFTALQIPETGIQIGVSQSATDNFYFASDINNGSRGLRLYNGNGGSGVPIMSILAGGNVGSGNVGIGANAFNPSLLLEVQGDFGWSNGPTTLHLWGSTIGDVGQGILFLRSGVNVVAVDKPTDKFGIRTNNPSQPLEVHGNAVLLTDSNALLIDGAFSGFPDNALNQAEISNDTGMYNALVIAGNRSAFDPDAPNPGRKVLVYDLLEVPGNLKVDGQALKPSGGGWTWESDISLKQNIQPLDDALEQLLRLRGVRFEWKDPRSMGNLTGPQIGLIAQEVEKVFPEWVSTRGDGLKNLTVSGFEALAVEAFRSLQNQIQALQAHIEALEARQRDSGGRPASPPGEPKPGHAAGGSKKRQAPRE
jgi:hypothetical protein